MVWYKPEITCDREETNVGKVLQLLGDKDNGGREGRLSVPWSPSAVSQVVVMLVALGTPAPTGIRMTGLAAVKGKILDGQVVGLQGDVRKLVRASSSGDEGQLIIRACSRFVYETPELEEQQFSAMLEIISICCEHHREHIIADPFFHFKSMFYIIFLAVRRKGQF
ncbi:hypothetical protein E2C01_026186 [Portunus trituberculatus]|uniref:Uncharacterized protein n=1 Tax=Portunus trituberculatus TaxID=210409 RepID=A0A5B7EHI1_PORTR|nr:hypothetical protein [Portunus trituberculatus]